MSSTPSTSESLSVPVLPWLNHSSRNSSFRSNGSDIHIMKRHVPEGGPSIPVKKWHRWTSYKIWLLLMNSVMFAYGLVILILGLCTYLRLYQRAIVMLIGERMLVNCVFCLVTSILGFIGIVLNNRPILAVYNLMMWPCFGMIAAVGYTAYRKNKWNIEGKLSYQWHYALNAEDRAQIQANLHCCGYKSFSDYHETSNKCYPRTLLPGCRYKYQSLTTYGLTITWIVAFSMVPVHLSVLLSGLLCSNHVNNKFGKGLPPKLYHADYRGIVAASGLPSNKGRDFIS
ncbi:uncharacterized protein B0P05DRAFT_610492 [Gilbertella persicaria]|uniref:uncharacterized protein n=1 Tax=Gilbertella persicaria TaxID=101096 RepID=UPI0022205353|nr:uncharacterized protein B0P05DRAFT_610492 [Gilbertella persicaria]KAI8083299.1 hypothetical protein B0P05DRAFT_610492 [Gilbertella persicaria]